MIPGNQTDSDCHNPMRKLSLYSMTPISLPRGGIFSDIHRNILRFRPWNLNFDFSQFPRLTRYSRRIAETDSL